jgi:hypothetical protein
MRVSALRSLEFIDYEGPKTQYRFLALKQLSLHAIVPIHTDDERAKFADLLRTQFVDVSEATWFVFARAWSDHVNGTTIFYKTPEYLRTYYNSWSELRKRKNTIAVHFEVVQAMRQTLTSSTRQRTAPPAIVPAVMSFPQSAIQAQIIPLALHPTSLDQRASQPVIAPLPDWHGQTTTA